jgi:hypothetical protein
VEVQIRPRTGAGPFRLGTAFGEAMGLARERGATVAPGPEGRRPPGKYVVQHAGTTLQFVLLFDADERLEGVELWRFLDEDEDVHVTLEGIDVFRTPSDDLPGVLEARGHEVVESDYGFDEITDLGLRFANNSSYEYPVDEEGDPLYYDYVLVADRI